MNFDKPSAPAAETASQEDTKQDSVEEAFQNRLKVDYKKISKIEGFSDLSEGQKFLVLENLEQINLGRIEEEALAQYKANTTKAKFLSKFSQIISKQYQIAKLTKSQAADLSRCGMKCHEKTIEQLIKGAKEVEVNKTESGRIEVQYYSETADMNDDQKKAVVELNRLANQYSRIPYEWSLQTATQEQRDRSVNARVAYEDARNKLLNMQEEPSQEDFVGAVDKYLAIDKKIQLNKFLTNHPEVEEQLMKIESRPAWQKALKDIVTERGIYLAAGALVRGVTVSMLGVVAAPITAGLIGGFRARTRAKETLVEREKKARRGDKDKSQEATTIVEAEGLINKLDKLTNQVNSGVEVKKIHKDLKSLQLRIDYTKEKIEKGQVNFGNSETRLSNQYDILHKLGQAEAVFYIYSLQDTAIEKKRLDKLMWSEQKKVNEAHKKYVKNQVIRGVAMSAGFAAAGWLVSHFVSNLCADEISEIAEQPQVKVSDSIEAVPGKVEPLEIEAEVEVPEKEEMSSVFVEKEAAPIDDATLLEIAETELNKTVGETIVKKGESPLLIAKNIYMEHAQEMGYESEMGSLKEWAELTSTRQIVSQYIREHASQYQDVIDKIGAPPENSQQFDDWFSKLPKKTFNEVLNEKVPNLVFEGDTIQVSANGDINAFNPAGELRTGHIEVRANQVAGNLQSMAEAPKKPDFAFTRKTDGGISLTEPNELLVEGSTDTKVSYFFYDLNNDGQTDGAMLLGSDNKLIEDIPFESEKGNLAQFSEQLEHTRSAWVEKQAALFSEALGQTELSDSKLRFIRELGIDPYGHSGLTSEDIAQLNFLRDNPALFDKPTEMVNDIFGMAEAMGYDNSQAYQLITKINYESVHLLKDVDGDWDMSQLRVLEALKGEPQKMIDALGFVEDMKLDDGRKINAAKLFMNINDKEALQELIGSEYDASKADVWWEGKNLKVVIRRSFRRNIELEPLA